MGVVALARKRLFFPDREISEAEYRRAFVEDQIFSKGAFEGEKIFMRKSKKQTRFARDLSLKLTDEEIGEAFDQFSPQYEAFHEEEKTAKGFYDDPIRGKLVNWGKPEAFLRLTVIAITARWAEKKGVPRPEL